MCDAKLYLKPLPNEKEKKRQEKNAVAFCVFKEFHLESPLPST